MHRTIVITFSTLDGVIEDPDGRGGTPNGGWAFRHGPEAVAGDKFKLGSLLETGALLFGRTTWELFAQLWPSRTGDFPDAMNRSRKLVVSSKRTDLTAWQNSELVDGDMVDAIAKQRTERDVIVIGSASVVHALQSRDLVDEYRIIVFPDVVGTGTRLFPDGAAPSRFCLASAEAAGPGLFLRYEREEP
jgi:dihydrofolate reductase